MGCYPLFALSRADYPIPGSANSPVGRQCKDTRRDLLRTALPDRVEQCDSDTAMAATARILPSTPGLPSTFVTPLAGPRDA